MSDENKPTISKKETVCQHGEMPSLGAAAGSQGNVLRDATKAEIMALAKAGGIFARAAEELNYAYHMNGGSL